MTELMDLKHAVKKKEVKVQILLIQLKSVADSIVELNKEIDLDREKIEIIEFGDKK